MAIVYKKKPTPPNHDPLDVVKELELLIHQHKDQVAFLFATGAKPSDINAAVRTLGGLCKILADIEYDLGHPKKIPLKYEEPKPSPIRDQILYNMERSQIISDTEKALLTLLQEDFPGIEPGNPENVDPLPLKNPEDKKYLSH